MVPHAGKAVLFLLAACGGGEEVRCTEWTGPVQPGAVVDLDGLPEGTPVQFVLSAPASLSGDTRSRIVRTGAGEDAVLGEGPLTGGKTLLVRTEAERGSNRFRVEVAPAAARIEITTSVGSGCRA